MEEQQAGVNYEGDATMPEPESPTGEQEVESQQPVPKSQNRYQKLANENRQYKEELGRLKQELGSLSSVRELDQYLKANPSQAKAVFELLSKPPSEPKSEDPFEGYRPHEKEALSAALELKKWKQQIEEQNQANYKAAISKNNERLMSAFEESLKADGFVDKKGNFNEAEVETIANAVYTQALRIADNPEMITTEEMQRAYKQTMAGLNIYGKRALGKAVNYTPPPPSAIVRSEPAGKRVESEEQRIARMVREYESFRG